MFSSDLASVTAQPNADGIELFLNVSALQLISTFLRYAISDFETSLSNLLDTLRDVYFEKNFLF